MKQSKNSFKCFFKKVINNYLLAYQQVTNTEHYNFNIIKTQKKPLVQNLTEFLILNMTYAHRSTQQT